MGDAAPPAAAGGGADISDRPRIARMVLTSANSRRSDAGDSISNMSIVSDADDGFVSTAIAVGGCCAAEAYCVSLSANIQIRANLQRRPVQICASEFAAARWSLAAMAMATIVYVSLCQPYR